MNDNDYELIELKSTLTPSIEDAVERGIDRAHKTVKNLSWFRVGDMRGKIDQGKVPHWQVPIKVGVTVKKEFGHDNTYETGTTKKRKDFRQGHENVRATPEQNQGAGAAQGPGRKSDR